VTKQLIAIVLTGFAVGATPVAQEKPPAPAEKPPVSTPLKVQVTISRFQGDKRVSSMPYTLSVNTNNSRADVSRLRMGGKVPIMTMATPTVDGKPLGVAAGPVTYQDVGTNIDCYASTTDDGRFKVVVTVEDTSVYPEDQAVSTVRGHPSFRTLVLTNAAILRDGQSTQFTSATDKVSGETVKIDVMLNVVK
jgi:hypothetical protein